VIRVSGEKKRTMGGYKTDEPEGHQSSPDGLEQAANIFGLEHGTGPTAVKPGL
jgi:hypothetical protein